MGTLINEQTRIVSNECVGPNLYSMVLDAPHIARTIAPGQFVQMKVPGMEAHVLRRPFSVFDRDAVQGIIEILYQAVGFGSRHMTELVGADSLEIIGSIGSGWQVPLAAKRALLVAGGVGAAPLFLLAEQLSEQGVQVDVILGAQTLSALVCKARYEELLLQPPRCSTDDGTFGRAGFCTSLVDEALSEAVSTGEHYDYLAVCGPELLMKIVANKALVAGVFCQISLEKRMACGVGACLGCVVETTEGLKRACVDGPVFDAEKVVF